MYSIVNDFDKRYLKVAIPCAMEGLFVILISFVDILMISTLGEKAIASVAIFSQPKMIMFLFSRSISTSIMVLTARKIGAANKYEAKNIIREFFVSICLFLFALNIIFYIFMKDIILFMGAENSYIDTAYGYSKICTIAVFFTSVSSVVQSVLIGFEKTKSVFAANILGNVVNVIMNYFLIFGVFYFPKLEVRGAGIATLIGSIATFLFTMYKAKELGVFEMKFSFIPEKSYIKEFFSVYNSVFTEQGSERFGMVVYSKMVASLGVVPFAVYSICMNICDIYYNFAMGLGKASTVFASNSFARKDEKKFKSYFNSGIKISLFFSFLSCVIIFYTRENILSLYNVSNQVFEMAKVILIYVAILGFMEAQAMICAGTLRGCLKTKQVATYSIISIAIIRPIFTAYLLYTLKLGIHGAFIAVVFDQSLRAIISSILVSRIKND